MRPKLLDLFCGAGGAGVGYHRAGFDIVGVDLLRKSSNPHPRIIQDVLTLEPWQLARYDAIHASPPCQAYSQLNALHRRNEYPDLVPEVRELLEASGRPYVIENVPGAPIQGIRLCGTMFGLRVLRHRYFESNCLLYAPPCGKHPEVVYSHCTSRHSRTLRSGAVDPYKVFLTIAGNMPHMDAHRDAIGIDWMTQSELSQAIPPAYTEYIGRQLLEFI